MASNEGDLTGSYEVVLEVNGEVVETKTVTLDGGQSQVVSFVVHEETPGLYSVDVNGMAGSFSVMEAAVETTPPLHQTAAPPARSGGVNGWLVFALIATGVARRT